VSLLVLDAVTKRTAHGRAEMTLIDGVSMDLAAGELVAIQGRRRSGRTTLLRLAAGVLAPDEGKVTFAGRNLRGCRVLGSEIGWAHREFRVTEGPTMADQVGFPLLSHTGRRVARQGGAEALATYGIGQLASAHPRDCQPHELLLAGLARAAVTSPRLLVVDEPVTGISPARSQQILDLLRAHALAGMAVLLTVEEFVAGIDRTLTIHEGKLHGRMLPAGADVVPLRGRSA